MICQKIKYVAIGHFLEQTTLQPTVFEQERPQKPGTGTISRLHGLKNDILSFFKFLQKKVSQLVKKAQAHFYPTLGVVICKNHVVRPLHSFNKYRKILFSSLEPFFCRNLENVGMSCLGQCNVEIVPFPGFQGLSCSKTAGFESGLFQKFSMATFSLSGSVTWWTAF